jgi:hypothetical protein
LGARFRVIQRARASASEKISKIFSMHFFSRLASRFEFRAARATDMQKPRNRGAPRARSAEKPIFLDENA